MVACSRLPDSRENENNCVGKASGGVGRGEAGNQRKQLEFTSPQKRLHCTFAHEIKYMCMTTFRNAFETFKLQPAICNLRLDKNSEDLAIFVL